MLIRTENELVDYLRSRCDALRMSYETVDRLAGVADGFTGKLFARPPIKRMSSRTLEYYLAVLAIGLQPVEDPEQLERIKRRYDQRAERYSEAVALNEPIKRVISRNFFRKIGRLGGAAFAKKCHAARIKKRKLSKQNRANALKRWHKPQIEEVTPDSALPARE
jgi:hypothetical protein